MLQLNKQLEKRGGLHKGYGILFIVCVLCVFCALRPYDLQEKDALKNCCGKCEFLSNETRQKTSDQMTFDYRFEYQMYASDGL